jgi:Flp pilus assembly protein TadG
MRMRKNQPRSVRRGAAVVEFAILAPVLILLIFGMVEYGRMVMVQQLLTNASREGARVGILDGSSDDDVKNAVIDKVGGAVPLDANDIVCNPSPVSSAGAGETVTVTVSIPFAEVSWLPIGMARYVGIPDTLSLSASSSMRRETVQ